MGPPELSALLIFIGGLKPLLFGPLHRRYCRLLLDAAAIIQTIRNDHHSLAAGHVFQLLVGGSLHRVVEQGERYGLTLGWKALERYAVKALECGVKSRPGRCKILPENNRARECH